MPVARLIGPGRPIPTPMTPSRSTVRLLEDLVDQLRRRVEPLLRRVVDVELAPGLRQHLVGEIGDRHPKVGVAEVDADGEARGRIEGEQHGRPAAGLAVGDAGRLGCSVSRPGLDQVGDDARAPSSGRARWRARSPPGWRCLGREARR